LAEATTYVNSQLEKWIIMTDALHVGGIRARLALKLFSYMKSESISIDSNLAKALKRSLSIKISDEAPLCFITNTTRGDKTLREVVFRVPLIPEGPKQKGYQDNLDAVLTWAAKMLQVNEGGVRIAPDPSLGSTVTLSAHFASLFLAMRQAADSETGSFVGPETTFESGYKASLPAMLAGVFLIRKYDSQVRKVQKVLSGDKIPKATTQQMLSEKINSIFEFKRIEGVEAWAIKFTKTVLNMVIRASNDHFPGKYIHSAKVLNNQKETSALLFSMGYTTVVPHGFKVMKTLLSDVFKKGDKQVIAQLSKENYPDGTPLPVVRTAATLLSPLLNGNPSKKMEDLILANPLLVNSKEILNYYKSISPIVDCLNKAYLFLRESTKKSSKVTPRMFGELRGRLIGLTANKPLLTGDSLHVDSVWGLPETIRNFLFTKFFFQWKKELKRKAEEPTSAVSTVTTVETSKEGDTATADIPMEVERTSPNLPTTSILEAAPPPSIPTPIKRRKIDEIPTGSPSTSKGKERVVLPPKVEPKTRPYSKENPPPNEKVHSTELIGDYGPYSKIRLENQDESTAKLQDSLFYHAKAYTLCGSDPKCVWECFQLSWTQATPFVHSVDHFLNNAQSFKKTGYCQLVRVSEQTSSGNGGGASAPNKPSLIKKAPPRGRK
jgi:hypothetical protein